MNKQLAKTSTTLNKNMTNTETLTVDNITVLGKIIIPIFTSPAEPTNPLQGQIYIKKNKRMQQYHINDLFRWSMELITTYFFLFLLFRCTLL